MHEDDDLLQRLERAAFDELPDDEDDAVDIIRELNPEDPDSPAADLTLGGYIDKHSRVPAFEGIDGQPYTVDIDTEQEPAGAHVAFFLFIRWAATGAGIMDHVESGDVARAETADAARAAAMELSLYEVKAELDQAIERRRSALEE